MTVDFKEKIIDYNNKKIKVTDLPETYSLTTYTYEEEVTRDYLYNHSGQIINICDANNLSRNLYLTMQLLELNKKPILCINMANELKKYYKEIDAEKLSKLLGLKVFLIDARNREEVKKIVDYIMANKNENNSQQLLKSENKNNNKKSENKYQLIKQNDDITNGLENNNFNNNYKELLNFDIEKIKKFFMFIENKLTFINQNYSLIKLLERDEFVTNKLNLSEEEKKQLEQVLVNFDIKLVATKRYEYIDKITSLCIKKIDDKKRDIYYGYSKLDKIVLNKYLCIPIFLIIICSVFFLTFSSVGQYISTLLQNFLSNYIFAPINSYIESITTNQFIISFIKDGICSGVGSVLIFLPQIVILFLLLSILEDSGYMSRLAFSLEDYFAKIGLSGKSVFTLLMGFGCNATSCMTSRTEQDKNSKIKTVIISPYISCSAKIPIYTVVCGAFFAHSQFLVIILLYILSVIVSILVSLMLEKTILKSGEDNFIMELPHIVFQA